MNAPVSLHPIARVVSPFPEKFGIPRQPGLAPSVCGRVELLAPYADPDALRGLDAFSHVWLIFLAHGVPESEAARTTVRPPRLGGNTRVGVFASRSLFRPNRLGLSLVRLEAVEPDPPTLVVSGLDLLDGTPVLDIKPYLPYAEAIPEAVGGYATAPPDPVPVTISAEAEPALAAADSAAPGFRQALVEVVGGDPRPAYRRDDPNATYRLIFAGRHVTIQATREGGLRILKMLPLP